MTDYEAYLYRLKDTNPYSQVHCQFCDHLSLAYDLLTHVQEEHPERCETQGTNNGGSARTTAFQCAECGAIAQAEIDTLDSGTTLTCNKCGGDTIILLLRVGEHVAKFDSFKETEQLNVWEQFSKRVDWILLQEQKDALVALLMEGKQPTADDLEGLLGFLDYVQDCAEGVRLTERNKQ